jgi:hypothetical protein
MFVDRSDTASIEAAIEAGVSAHVVDGLRKDRVKPILGMAISRFNALRPGGGRLRCDVGQRGDPRAPDAGNIAALASYSNGRTAATGTRAISGTLSCA